MEGLPNTITVFSDDNGSRPRSNSQSKEDGHHRKGSNISDLIDPPTGPIAPPSPNRHASLENDALQSIAETARARLEQNRNGENNEQKVSLDGLLNIDQYEDEATTHILKTLEDQLGSTPAFETSILEGLSHEASQALLEESYSVDKVDSSSHRSNSRRSEEDQKPLLIAKPRHRRVMSVDDQLANLTDQLLDHGFLDIAPDQAPAVEPLSEFERNAQVAFGGPGFANSTSGNVKARDRLFSGEKITLEPVQESGGSDVDEDKQSINEGVVDLESQNTSQKDSQGLHKPPMENFAYQHTLSVKSNHQYRSTLNDMTEKVKNDVAAWNFFFRPQRATLKKYFKLMLAIVLPLVGVAALLFYVLGNPKNNGPDGPSVSWILLFVVRLWVTLTLALAVQGVVIDVMCVGTRVIPRLLGPLVTLWIVQSKGWPFVVFTWSILNFGMLYGKGAFAAHWCFWQNTISLFNESNPAGDIVSNNIYRIVLTIGATVPVAVSVKRLAVGLFLGRQSFLHFGERIAKVMDKMLLIGQVAKLARRMEKEKAMLQRKNMANAVNDHPNRKSANTYQHVLDQDDDASSTKNSNVLGLMESEKHKLMHLLDRWEEPERRSAANKKASISAVLRFRNALALIHNDYPFSHAFGLANKRQECVESARNVFRRLLSEGETDVEFETIAASLALREGQFLDPDRVRKMIRIFRPNRDGTLSLVDFIKSVDAVYKEFRLLQASIENSAQIDRAFEAIFNTVFYVTVVVIIMSQLGLDPMAMFLSLSSVLLAFAFVIGSAASKHFEGILFILLRRPYNIGDSICVTDKESETGLMGSIGWVVQDVTLFETTICWLPTMETATVANGAMANSRIVNWARSPNARFIIYLYFPIETKYETLTLFRGAIEEYMKARPREWLAFNALRVLDIFTNKGYMRVELRVQHREAWQNTGAIYDSRGNLVSFCNEVQKLLGMQYKAPPVPIDNRAANGLDCFDGNGSAGVREPASPSVAVSEPRSAGIELTTREKFRQAAENNHKMFF